jgi:TonB family protein
MIAPHLHPLILPLFLSLSCSALAVACADPEPPTVRAPEPAPASAQERDARLAAARVPPETQPQLQSLPSPQPPANAPRPGSAAQLRNEWPWNEHPGWTLVAFGPRARAFAVYMNAMHNQVHPSFAEGYLRSLDKLPADDPRNAKSLAVELHVVVDPSGALAKLEVGKASGVPAFDRETAEAFARAAPFPQTPVDLQSPDGNVYVRWELRRDEVFSCTTINARPFPFERPTPLAPAAGGN